MHRVLFLVLIVQGFVLTGVLGCKETESLKQEKGIKIETEKQLEVKRGMSISEVISIRSNPVEVASANSFSTAFVGEVASIVFIYDQSPKRVFFSSKGKVLGATDPVGRESTGATKQKK